MKPSSLWLTTLFCVSFACCHFYLASWRIVWTLVDSRTKMSMYCSSRQISKMRLPQMNKIINCNSRIKHIKLSQAQSWRPNLQPRPQDIRISQAQSFSPDRWCKSKARPTSTQPAAPRSAKDAVIGFATASWQQLPRGSTPMAWWPSRAHVSPGLHGQVRPNTSTHIIHHHISSYINGAYWCNAHFTHNIYIYIYMQACV